MFRAHIRMSLIVFAVLVSGAWTPAAAQVLGVFRWQMQPYCNLVTFTVIQQGPTYQLTGNDNLCGAPAFAPATGTATPNPNGTISLGFNIVTPSGASAHVSATVNLSNVSGTWTDADGNTGPFVFNPPGVQGLPRPDPTRSTLITSAQLAASIFAGTGSATTVARSDHTHDERYFTEAETNAVVAAAVGAGAAGVLESTGSLPANFTPELEFFGFQVTTPKAGRLLISTPGGIWNYNCSSGSNYYAFLTLDGVAIPNSVVYSPLLAALPRMSGLVLTEVPAGVHTIRVAVRCSAGTNSGYTWAFNGRASVVVLP